MLINQVLVDSVLRTNYLIIILTEVNTKRKLNDHFYAFFGPVEHWRGQKYLREDQQWNTQIVDCSSRSYRHESPWQEQRRQDSNSKHENASLFGIAGDSKLNRPVPFCNHISYLEKTC
jgi:hypothetical protein